MQARAAASPTGGVDEDMLAGVELDAELPLRAHAAEQVLSRVGGGRAAGPATERARSVASSHAVPANRTRHP